MKITNAIIFVAVDGEEKVRQVLLEKSEKELFITMINSGMLPCETVKISSTPLDVLKFKD